MATPPPFPSIKPEEFRDAPKWFRKFLDTLNPWLVTVYRAMGGQLDKNNLSYRIKTVTFTTRPVVANTWPLVIENDLGRTPELLWIGRLVADNQSVRIATEVTLQGWRLNSSGKIELDGISGLDADTRYVLTVRYE